MTIFFKAPTDFYEACEACTNKIGPQEVVAEFIGPDDATFMHLSCFEELRDDAREVA